MGSTTRLVGYLDHEGRLAVFPAKFRAQRLVAEWLSGFFEPGKTYNEREVCETLNSHHSFNDPALLRRILVDHGFMERTRDCREYRRKVA